MQLRGAYLGVNNALRAGVRDSQITDPDDMSDVGEMQNLLELHISDASVFVSGSGAPGDQGAGLRSGDGVGFLARWQARLAAKSDILGKPRGCTAAPKPSYCTPACL